MKSLNGEHFRSAPYGYVKGSTEKNKLIVNEETATVVRQIFQMCVAGQGIRTIARALKEQKILAPRAYTYYRMGGFGTETVLKYPYHWHTTIIKDILKNKTYLGHIANGKTQKTSLTLKRTKYLPEEEHIVVKNMHEPIID